MSDFGYHINHIEKGVLGDFSKIEEEYYELKDAKEQKSKIMELVELSDFIGAIELYIKKQKINTELKDVLDKAKLLSNDIDKFDGTLESLAQELNFLKLTDFHKNYKSIPKCLINVISSVIVYLKVEHTGIELDDLVKMKDITKRAFENGHRI